MSGSNVSEDLGESSSATVHEDMLLNTSAEQKLTFMGTLAGMGVENPAALHANLIDDPTFAYSLLYIQLFMGLIDPGVALGILSAHKRVNEGTEADKKKETRQKAAKGQAEASGSQERLKKEEVDPITAAVKVKVKNLSGGDEKVQAQMLRLLRMTESETKSILNSVELKSLNELKQMIYGD